MGLCAQAQKAAEKKQPASSQTKTEASARSVKNVTPDEAEKLISERKDVVVLDVRTPEEFEMGHLAGATNASFIDDDFADKIKEVEGKPVLVHCAAGTRSLKAVKEMSASGKFPEIYHMNGGYAAWTEAKKTIVKTPKASK